MPNVNDILNDAAEFFSGYYGEAEAILLSSAEHLYGYWNGRSADTRRIIDEAMNPVALAADILGYDYHNLPENKDAAMVFRLATLGMEDLQKISARLFTEKYLCDPAGEQK
jgi:hypothetical protein